MKTVIPCALPSVASDNGIDVCGATAGCGPGSGSWLWLWPGSGASIELSHRYARHERVDYPH